jgi:hypothetical protein
VEEEAPTDLKRQSQNEFEMASIVSFQIEVRDIQ